MLFSAMIEEERAEAFMQGKAEGAALERKKTLETALLLVQRGLLSLADAISSFGLTDEEVQSLGISEHK